MAKTKEELNALKEEAETLSSKLTELTDEELEGVNGGTLGTLMFRPGRDGFNKNNLVFNPKKNRGFLGDLIVKGGNIDDLQKLKSENSGEEKILI